MARAADFLYAPFVRRVPSAGNGSALALDFPLPPLLAAAVRQAKSPSSSSAARVAAFVHRVICLESPIVNHCTPTTKGADLFAAAWAPFHVLKHMKILDGSWVTIGSGCGRFRRARIFLTPSESNVDNTTCKDADVEEEKEDDDEDDDLDDLYDSPGDKNAPEEPEEEIVEALIYLSPALVFNLGLGVDAADGESTVAVYPYGHPFSPALSIESSDSQYLADAASSAAATQDTPALAQEVTIARVRSPDSNGHASYTAEVAEYFRIGRILSTGDIFGISVPEEGTNGSAASAAEEDSSAVGNSDLDPDSADPSNKGEGNEPVAWCPVSSTKKFITIFFQVTKITLDKAHASIHTDADCGDVASTCSGLLGRQSMVQHSITCRKRAPPTMFSCVLSV